MPLKDWRQQSGHLKKGRVDYRTDTRLESNENHKASGNTGSNETTKSACLRCECVCRCDPGNLQVLTRVLYLPFRIMAYYTKLKFAKGYTRKNDRTHACWSITRWRSRIIWNWQSGDTKIPTCTRCRTIASVLPAKGSNCLTVFVMRIRFTTCLPSWASIFGMSSLATVVKFWTWTLFWR